MKYKSTTQNRLPNWRYIRRMPWDSITMDDRQWLIQRFLDTFAPGSSAIQIAETLNRRDGTDFSPEVIQLMAIFNGGENRVVERIGPNRPVLNDEAKEE